MADRIRWGIISTAMINDVIIRAIEEAPRSELLAVASRSEAKAKSYASLKGIPKAYGGYEALLADGEIDAVYVSVPNSLHREWAVEAAEAKKHVLCEKPLVTTSGDFEAVESSVRKNGVVLFEAFMYLHHPQTLKAKELVRGGRLGTLRFIDSCFDYFLPFEETENIRVNPTLHGGSLWDVGVYPNSLSIAMAGEGAPVEVYAVTGGGRHGVDERSFAQMRFASGAIAQLSVSIRNPFRIGAHVVGDEGHLFIESPWKPGLDGKATKLVLTTRDDRREEFSFDGISPYFYEVAAMEACVLDGAPPVVPLSMSRDFLRSMLALRESAKEAKPVPLK